MPLFPITIQPENIQRPKWGKPFSVEEVVAGLRGDGFFLAVLHHDLDLLSSQAVRFEEGAKIGLPLLTPMLDDDLSGMKLDEVEAAAPDDESDYAVAIVRRQLQQAVLGSLQDRLTGVFKGPLNRGSNGP